jgi:hypothetical protein
MGEEKNERARADITHVTNLAEWLRPSAWPVLADKKKKIKWARGKKKNQKVSKWGKREIFLFFFVSEIEGGAEYHCPRKKKVTMW